MSAYKLIQNLPQLQNLMKRDPESYQDEFDQRFRHYETQREIFLSRPKSASKQFTELVTFLAHVSHCYRNDPRIIALPEQLILMLKHQGSCLDPEVRNVLCKALIMLRNKGFVSPALLIETFFGVVRIQDKSLRKLVRQYFINDMKTICGRQRNMKLNSALQNYVFGILKESSNPVVAKFALDISSELYRRNIWKDAKTANVVAEACFSKVTKISVAALSFLLDSDRLRRLPGEQIVADSDEDSDDDQKTEKELLLQHRVGRKSKKRKKQLSRSLDVLRKKRKAKHKEAPEIAQASAIQLIYDPQGFAERLYKSLESSRERFEVKLLMLSVLSKMIGVHQLFVFNIYPFVQRFLKPHQREVTRILQYTAQACHELIPPDTLEPVIRTIADNFITERNSGEVMAVGLNAVREICVRCPLAVPDYLLQDFTMYRNYRDKSVSMAARSLIQLYRKVNPSLLTKKDRGRPTDTPTCEQKSSIYAGQKALDFLPGAEYLDNTENDINSDQSTNENDSTGNDDGSDSDASEGWVDLSSEDDDQDENDHQNEDDNVETCDKPNNKAIPEQKIAAFVDTAADNERKSQNVDVAKLTTAERQEKAEQVSQSRILSQTDFARLDAIQIQQDAGLKGRVNAKLLSKAAKKRKASVAEGNSDLVSLDDIERVYKRRKHDKESRLATVMEGRRDRPKYSHKAKRANPHASTTNKEKQKRKAFTMIRRKVGAQKQKRSYKQKQIALRNSLLKMQKRKK